jgi:hypothetical protein
MEILGNKKLQNSCTEYCCEKCDYKTVRKSSYDKHLLTPKHNLEMSGTKKLQNSCTDYCCEKCNYKTVRKSSYDKHLLTSKHQMEMSGNKVANKVATTFECEKCSKVYQTSSGLWKHNQICDATKPEIEQTDKDVIVATLLKQNAELHDKIIELCKNGITNNTITNSNNNNKTFNLQFFLNETCKDAMNLKDFIDSVVLQLSDIDNIGEVGFVKGMANLIISKINLLGETKRPIHCTDSKREVMYVKDENKWEKDAKKEKMRLLIQKMEKQLPPLMIAFSNNHKQKYRTDSEIIKHQQIIYEVYGGVNDDITNNEIIQHISKKTTIEKTTHIC